MNINENRKAVGSVVDLMTKIIQNLLIAHRQEDQVLPNLTVSGFVPDLNHKRGELGASLLLPFTDVIIIRFEQNMNRKLKKSFPRIGCPKLRPAYCSPSASTIAGAPLRSDQKEKLKSENVSDSGESWQGKRPARPDDQRSERALEKAAAHIRCGEAAGHGLK